MKKVNGHVAKSITAAVKNEFSITAHHQIE